jgi:hypothetical protein
MHPDHVAKLLKREKLVGIENAPRLPKPSTASDTPLWTPQMDRQFEEAAKTYEEGKSRVCLGEDTPLREIVKNPIGRIWYEAWSCALSGGFTGKNSVIARELLPILRATHSPLVFDLCFRALRSIHRLSAEDLDPMLLQEVEDAVTRSVQKLETSL